VGVADEEKFRVAQNRRHCVRFDATHQCFDTRELVRLLKASSADADSVTAIEGHLYRQFMDHHTYQTRRVAIEAY